jgi:dipeptidase D
MSNVLGNLEPKELFTNFEALTKIPRGSGNEQQVSDYLKDFGEKLGLETIQEECLNVIIKKPGTSGYENGPTVILQGHMDMVCVKEQNISFDFDKEAIPIVIDGDMITTKGTTLGADNGIAVAMAMAILESKDIPHPPITALFTVSEETTMGGAENLDSKDISGDILINIDSEEEGIMTTSCAGGVDNIVRLPIIHDDREDKANVAFNISIKGLLGGHSGLEINKNRGNAIILLGRLLDDLREEIHFDISSIAGGEKINAIPKYASCDVLIDSDDKGELDKVIERYQEIFKNEFKTPDPNIIVECTDAELVDKVFNIETKNACIDILRLTPFGVQTMSSDIEGLVQSSTNLGVMGVEGEEVVFRNSVRSSVHSLKGEINSRIEIMAHLNGAKMILEADYPEWEFRKESRIRDLMAKIYKDMYNKEMEVAAIHAGLECGLLKEALGDIDMVSIGPNMYDVHTPVEHLSISSTKRVYEFLCEVLKELKS